MLFYFKKFFTNNLTWLLFGFFIILHGKMATGSAHSLAGMISNKMMPYTIFALANFIMGAYVRARFHEYGDEKRTSLKVVTVSTLFVLLCFLAWGLKMTIA